MTSPSVVCPSCHTPLPSDAQFCPRCGASTPTQSVPAVGDEQLVRLRRALADRYVVEGELGRGGMAVVYSARDLRHGRRVAIKVLSPDLAASLAAERFLREIGIAAKLSHPHILPVFDSGEADGVLFYVMPFVEGESLRDRLRRELQLPLEDALAIVREVADGLAFAHRQGVIHRDIKPENILLSAGHAIVADFGIARALSEAGGESLTGTGMSIGTPLYMSPEQAAGGQKVDSRADLYSLACTLYEMLAGEPPFTGPTAQAIIAKHLAERPPSLGVVRQGAPPHVASAIERALAKAPADRFPSVTEFVSALTSARGTQVPSRRRRVLIGAAAAVAVIVAVTGLLRWVLPLDGRGSAGGNPVHRQVTFARAFSPAISPDGRYLAYKTCDSTWNCSLAVQDLRSNSVVTVLDSLSVWGSVRWAPAGDRLLAADGERVIEVPLLGGSSQALAAVAHPRRVELAVFAPDGHSWVRVEQANDTAFFVTRQVGSPSLEDTVRLAVLGTEDIDWSDRGGWLVSARSRGSEMVLRVSLDARGVDTLFARPFVARWTSLRAARWAPAGDAVLLSLDNELVRVRLGARRPEVLMSGVMVGQFDLSADGRVIAYVRAERPSGRALVLTFQGGARRVASVTELTEGTLWTGFAAVSPDGATVAFARGPVPWRADLYVSSIRGGPARRVTFDSGAVNGIEWAPDSRRLAFLSAGSRSLGMLDLQTGEARRLAGDVNTAMHQFRPPLAWFDSTTVFFGKPGYRLVSLDVRAGTQEVLPESPFFWLSPFWLTPSPDGHQFAVVDSSGSILTVDRGTGRRRVVARPRAHVILLWSTDGRIVFIDSASDRSRSLMAVRVSGGDAHVLYDVAPCWFTGPVRISVSADLRTVVCTSPEKAGSADVWVVENLLP